MQSSIARSLPEMMIALFWCNRNLVKITVAFMKLSQVGFTNEIHRNANHIHFISCEMVSPSFRIKYL